MLEINQRVAKIYKNLLKKTAESHCEQWYLWSFYLFFSDPLLLSFTVALKTNSLTTTIAVKNSSLTGTEGGRKNLEVLKRKVSE